MTDNAPSRTTPDAEGAGLVFNIQRFSVHDGPGIRTTVFLKGCPLRCQWCANPESLHRRVELMVNDARCIFCGRCAEVCEPGAIRIDEGRRILEREACTLCLKCAEVCPTGSLSRIGRWMMPEEVIEDVLKDAPFYRNSGGGMTLSGGEPLAQPEFCRMILSLAKQQGLHTVLDTSGSGSWKVLSSMLEHTDLVLYDLKHLDPQKHRASTGIDNRLILENARRTARRARMWLRVPLIPNFNDDEPTVWGLVELAMDLGAERVFLLPYHRWGAAKYGRLGMQYEVEELTPPSAEALDRLAIMLREFGDLVTLGNLP